MPWVGWMGGWVGGHVPYTRPVRVRAAAPSSCLSPPHTVNQSIPTHTHHATATRLPLGAHTLMKPKPKPKRDLFSESLSLNRGDATPTAREGKGRSHSPIVRSFSVPLSHSPLASTDVSRETAGGRRISPPPIHPPTASLLHTLSLLLFSTLTHHGPHMHMHGPTHTPLSLPPTHPHKKLQASPTDANHGVPFPL